MFLDHTLSLIVFTLLSGIFFAFLTKTDLKGGLKVLLKAMVYMIGGSIVFAFLMFLTR